MTLLDAHALIAFVAGEAAADEVEELLRTADAGAGDSVATADAPLARAARAEGVSVVALPDRAGHRP